MSRVLAALLAAFLWPSVAQAEITGKPSIIHGDTIEIAGQRIRLYGIDAPEPGQTCLAHGRRWRCGMEAEMALAYFVGKNWVTCLERNRDRFGRVIAVCYAGGVGGPDLGKWLVTQGWALAYPRHSSQYVGEEEAARAARRGIWRGPFVPPQAWRRGRRLQTQTE